MYTGTHTDYQLAQAHQTRSNRQAHNDQLAAQIENNSAPRFSHKTILTVIIVLFAAALFVLPQAANAQINDMLNDGSDFGHPAMLAFRMGNYYYVQGNYEKAIERLQFAVDEMPAAAYNAFPNLTEAYRILGDAQFAQAQYDAALSSYTLYVEMTGEEADPLVIVMIEQLGGTVDTIA